MSQVDDVLTALGFHEKEIHVYRTLLQIGTAPASLIGQRTGIKRSTAQYACQQLVAKGVLSMIQKNNTFLFTAEPPERLLHFLGRQRQKLQQQETELQKAIGSLRALMRSDHVLPRIQYYEGIDGIEKLIDAMPAERREVFTFSAGDFLFQNIPEIVTRFRQRSQKNFRSKKIIRCEKYRSLHADDRPQPSVETRYFPSLDELRVDIQIIDDRVSMVSIEETAPVGLIIRHKDIARAMKDIFLQLWDGLGGGGVR